MSLETVAHWARGPAKGPDVVEYPRAFVQEDKMFCEEFGARASREERKREWPCSLLGVQKFRVPSWVRRLKRRG